MENVSLEVYSSQFKQAVIELILHIQRDEFGVPITLEDQPDLNSIEQFYQKNNGNFWVALHDAKVVGTIALIDIGQGQLALRKMFVREGYRGRPFHAGQALMDQVFQWMSQRHCTEVYLGTLERFEAARRFYLRNGFTRIDADDLPPRFPRMRLDTTFFKKTIDEGFRMTSNGDHRTKIADYRQADQAAFEKLNRDWIEKYFWMEPVDYQVLQHPEDHIIRNGGSILMAFFDDQVAGTVALKFVEPGIYEFTKMAVDEKFRGKKIGLALGQAAVQKAKKLNAKKIILYSNTVLEPAIALYRKMGFVEIPVDGPYKRSNIKMELEV